MLREPLLHFVLIGILLFAVDAFLRGDTVQAGEGEIVVTQGRIESLAALFTKTWQRPPTAEELDALIDDHVLEEALYREGLALGVHQDDTIIRRRVRQKMEFVVDDVVELTEPTEEELETWLAQHAESYAMPARYRFRQVFLNPERRGDALQADATMVLEGLRSSNGGADPRELGDASLLEHAFADAATELVARTFGQDFVDGLAAQPIGAWSGPVESAFGVHLVIVDAKTEGRTPALDEVRDAVVRDWSYARREEASQAFYGELLSRYCITIEWPEEADGDSDSSGGKER